MSKRERERSYDNSEPSTSSGHHKKKPYDRSDSERFERKGLIKTVSEDDYFAASTSSSSRNVPMVEPSKIKTEIKTEIDESENAGSTQGTRSRRKMEPIFVSRPSTLVDKKGKIGAEVNLESNHFKLMTVPNWCLYQYRVDFVPEEDRTFVRKGMLRLHKEKVGPHIFDGTLLYTNTRLPDKMEFLTMRKCDNTPVNITICLVGTLSPEDPHYSVIFNIIMRKTLEYLELQLVGRDFYDAKNKSVVHQHRLELWPGYITVIKQHEYNILMCVEITHKVMHQETLLHVLRKCYDRRRHEYKADFCNSVIGIMVLTDYNNHTYRIEDVDFDTSPSSTFPMKNGQHVSYQDYYRNKYRIEITDASQPMLVTRSKPKQRNAGQGDLVYLVPELCRATGLNDSMRENFQLMKALSAHTCIGPDSRIDKLMKFNNRLRQEPKVVQEFKDWNMTLDRNLLRFKGRVLQPERLLLAESKVSSGVGDWGRDIQRMRLLHCKELKNWTLVANGRDQYSVERFIQKLQQVSHQISFRINKPSVQWLREDKASTYVETLEYLLSKSVPELVFCVVSNNRSDRYAAIKKKCCIDRPIPSQVFLQKNLDGKNAMSIATKVAIQMNCKLGGAPWTIENSVKGLMAIGFDVCRDATTKGKNYLAMVATVDQRLTRYFSLIDLYEGHENLGDQLCASIHKAVMAYKNYNNALPMRIIIYRDGVSDGQLRQVYENEVQKLTRKLEEMYYGPNFKMAFIVVTKKINVRLFDRNNRGGNPKIGTIVDDVITDPLKYDFFLVSQQVRQGTISPTSYNVIYDNTDLDPTTMQATTFKLTHVYYNCSSTVRVPAPCHYAHKLSLLVGKFIHKPPNTQLQNQLYFL